MVQVDSARPASTLMNESSRRSAPQNCGAFLCIKKAIALIISNVFLDEEVEYFYKVIVTVVVAMLSEHAPLARIVFVTI